MTKRYVIEDNKAIVDTETMTDNCRVSMYYPLTAYMQEGVRYIARLDGKNPVTVLNEVDNYTTKYVFQKALNLFEIIELYKKTVPESEDWFVAYQSGFDFTEDVRNRNPRKYTKGMVYEMMLRLAHHGAFKCFSTKDIIKESFRGEERSYFRPHQTIHVCNSRCLCD